VKRKKKKKKKKKISHLHGPNLVPPFISSGHHLVHSLVRQPQLVEDLQLQKKKKKEKKKKKKQINHSPANPLPTNLTLPGVYLTDSKLIYSRRIPKRKSCVPDRKLKEGGKTTNQKFSVHHSGTREREGKILVRKVSGLVGRWAHGELENSPIHKL
jgi:hypothetical protein